MESSFGFADVKSEGSCIKYDKDEKETPSSYKWTWVERRVPVEFHDELHLVIDRFLEGKGIYDI